MQGAIEHATVFRYVKNFILQKKTQQRNGIISDVPVFLFQLRHKLKLCAIRTANKYNTENLNIQVLQFD